MRALCTVSAPLEVCAPPSRPPLPPLPAGARFLALRIFGTPQTHTLYFLVEAKSRVREVYAQTCHHFSKQGMLDADLFGLAVLIDGEYLFLDPESKLSKYGPKNWRSSHTHGLDANGKPLLEFHFLVQFYIESPLMLRDEITRHHYYLQLKSNAVHRDLPRDISEQALLLLGGLALQADFGDCVNSNNNNNNSENDGNGEPKSQHIDYFRVEDYLPPSLRTAWGSSALHSCHRENRGMSRADAETHYIREACGLHEAINAHIYKMKSNKNENGCGSTMLIIYAKGLKMITETSSQQQQQQVVQAHTSSSPSPSSTSSAASQTSLLPPTSSSSLATATLTSSVTFLWPAISKLSFDRKKFELRSGENKITLFSNVDDKNKMLLALCRETHQFSMKIAPRLTEAIKREEEESNCIHACYLYSRALNLQYHSKSKNDQRISVISSTSSNTTSGIISDRVHSEDELEILITTPPLAAPSTESLALAHLLDCPSVSRQTSSVGQLKDPLNGSIAALSIHSKNSEILEKSELELVAAAAASPTSQRNLGSQCSSTCSTLVIDTLSLSRTPILGAPLNASGRRQASTCSSLELEFSHTAQNSIVSSELTTTSSTNENRFASVVDGLQNDDVETASGVYTINHPAPTETSGVYTMNSSELTGQSSEIAESESHESSHYGSFHPNSEIGDKINGNTIDSVDGEFRPSAQVGHHEFRMRSDSNISAAGSFRGDGSDPTEGKHNPLSAEELTELIVGRGTYPSHKTVSDTMDSDCDYVTLPLPLDGESYLQGSEDTAPTEDEYENELLKVPAPSPPQRIDSRSCNNLPEQPPPPPYNAHHETTGLRGPDIPPEIPALPALLREKPPKIYPRKSVRSFSSISSISTSTTIPEETPARFITTRPHINILKAHSMIGESAKPSYAAPTVNTINNLSQSPLPSASALGIPIVPYHNLHPAHKSFSHPFYHHEKPVTPRTCVLLPVIKQPRSHQSYVPPPMSTRPSPPPPPMYASQLARSQIELYQQQLYSDVDYVIYPLQDPAVSQQEYLDSKQGSIIAAMAAQGNHHHHPHPPTTYFACPTLRSHNRSWDACKNHALYRSTPFLSMALSSASRYASTQNLSDTYVQLPGTYSPLYSPSVASLCSSYEPPPPLRPQRYHHVSNNTKVTNSLTSNGIFSLSRSDDNILNSIDTMPKSRRPIPPPPSTKRHTRKPPMPTPKDDSSVTTAPSTPPSVPAKPASLKTTSSSASLKSQSRSSAVNQSDTTTTAAATTTTTSTANNITTPSTSASVTSPSSTKPLDLKLSHVICPESNRLLQLPSHMQAHQQAIDISILREKSKHMDLPLISALCNDRSLLKQTKAFVGKNGKSSSTLGNPNSSNSPSKVKNPGLSTGSSLKASKKISGSQHRHPNDKLPPIPVEKKTTETSCGNKNNYVMDPIPLKQKSNKSNEKLGEK